MKMKCCLMFLLAVATAGVTFAEKPQMTQAELDVYVDREMFKFIHGEDYRSAIEWLKAKGATDEMLGKAYAKVARQNLDSSVQRGRKCYRAIEGVANFCTGDERLTNLLYFAEHVKVDNVRAHAIWLLARKTTPVNFTAFAERVVASTNLGFRAGAALMSGLSEAYANIDQKNLVWKRRILQALRRHLEVGGKGSVIADRALTDYDEEYRVSEFRKQVAERILNPKTSPLNGNQYIKRSLVEEEFRKVLKGDVKK